MNTPQAGGRFRRVSAEDIRFSENTQAALGLCQGTHQVSACQQPIGTDHGGPGTNDRNHTLGGINETHNQY